MKINFHLSTEAVGVFTSLFGLIKERCYLVHVLSDLLTVAVMNILFVLLSFSYAQLFSAIQTKGQRGK